MEIEEGENKRPPEGDKSTKRKMKTAYQLELLEKTYAVATYPSESMRAELSEKLGLTDRQLQMWFCHRRLKDRKDPRKRPRNEMAAGSGDEVMVGTAEEPVNELALGPVLGSDHFSQGETRRARPRAAVAVPRIAGELPVMKRYYEPPESILELRAIAFVESQLGEPLREDGPVLGVEFGPLPPDAFGAPIAAMEGQQNQVMRPYDTKMFERQEMKLIKASSFMPSMEQSFVPSFSGGKRKPPAGSVHAIHPETGARALHEYQVLPKQPSVRSDVYERVGPSHLYDTPLDASSGRATSLASGGSFLHETDPVGAGYNFQGEVSNVTMSQRGKQSHVFSSSSTDYDSVLHISTLANIPADAQFGAHPVIRLENSFVSSNRQASLNEDALRMERKRKSEEARIGKEVEAHEKQIRKELEKQDIMRRKREEQMRREMEKHDRERRKEEERLMREKQREEERLQREQRREIERRERFLQKETLRAEKMRQKEALRGEKKAARIKAANERATARRIARESMELIEDERLELMELAASSKGLPSIISLDCDTLQNLESFRDMLSIFPPKSVPLKRPFTVQPWIISEEIIGNLLMVWKFLITFADALELWPFTLDEFVQAFHDYDPRLLGEIHVSLLKSIIKDIEDATRTPSIELGANQNAAANPGGGHPQIVEGAHAWGFDISSWQRHLNPLTWPEILRQFALSAGFGPQLKKRSVPQACFSDENEGNDDEYIICTLRNGVAAESAVARMKEKGFSYWRRSRRRLTPGTVKFAAFHVLSLEGSEGLTILEVADKIQKSGLRDLTTSKTPEASIAAALSRDTTLFERTAPSTYCVQPAFRKDPANADAILLAAREKLRIFQSRFSDPEEAEKDTEDTDDVEREDDSESEGAEDPEVDDLGNPPTLDKVVFHPNVMKGAQESGCVQNGKGETACNDIKETSPGFSSEGKGLSPFPLDGTKSISRNSQLLDVAAKCHEVSNADQEDTEIDESNSGEPWVQGLMEGEYSDLSIEERLNAVVALIGMAIEENSIRVILEERLEAANALKKQMWAEAQLDKRRIKEEYVTKLQYPSFAGTKAEVNLAGSAIYGNHSLLCNLDNKSDETSLNPAAKEELVCDLYKVQNDFNNMYIEKNKLGHEYPSSPDKFPFQQYGHAAEKPRSQLKSYIGHRAEQMYVYRSLPLGQDRRRNRYWQFSTSSRNDPGSGRIFFESRDGCWRLIDSEEGFDALLDSLDRRGIRESHLYSMLQKIEMSFKETVRKNLYLTNSVDISRVSVKEESVPSSSDGSMGTDSLSTVCCPNSDTLELSLSFRIELGRNEIEKNNALKRYQDSQKWLWRECFNMPILCAMKDGKKRCPELLTACDVCHDLFWSEDEHCAFCHKTFQSVHNLDIEYSEHVNCGKKKVDSSWNFHFSNSSLPTRIQVLKAQLALIEASIPPEVFQPFWTEVNRKSWGAKLHSTSSSEDILQLLTLLECAIKRGCLSSNFETTKELLGSSTIAFPVDEGAILPATVPILPWIPQTTASVALRLMELDASISYLLQKTVESRKDKESGNFIKLPSRYAVIKNAQELEPAGTPEQAENELEEIWADARRGCKVLPNMNPVRVRGSRGRGRGRSHSGRSQRGSGSSRTISTRQNPWNSDKSVRRRGGRPRTRGQGQRRGRRTMKRKKIPESKVVAKETAMGGFGDTRRVKQISSGGSPRISEREWDAEETGRIYAEERNDISAGISESDDNGLASEDESGDQVDADYADVYDGKFEVLMDDSEEEDEDEEGDRDGEEEGDRDGIEDEDGDAGMDGYEDSHGEGNGDEGDGNRDGDEDDDDEDGEGNRDEDEGTSSTSSDCSD